MILYELKPDLRSSKDSGVRLDKLISSSWIGGEFCKQFFHSINNLIMTHTSSGRYNLDQDSRIKILELTLLNITNSTSFKTCLIDIPF